MRLLGRLSTSAALCLDHCRAWTSCTSTIITSVSMSTYSMMLDTKQVDRLIAARQQLVKRAPVHLLRIKGVTFEDRQPAVQQLEPGQPLMFQKQPNHPIDPGAVAIATLDGVQLGYASQLLKDNFRLPVCFGNVVSVGQVNTADGSGNWGAVVSCSPPLWGMSLDLLPQSWAQQRDEQALQQHTKNSDGQAVTWQEYEALVLASYQQCCAVTGIPDTELPLQLVPRWLFDHHKMLVQLNPSAPFIPMCQPLAELQRIAEAGLDTASLADRQAALELLKWINRWSERECAKYVEYVEKRRRLVEHEGWSLEVAPV